MRSVAARAKKEFGDFQTPHALARDAVSLVAELFGAPGSVVEPTAGAGAFVRACLARWETETRFDAYELNADYAAMLHAELGALGVRVFQRNFFRESWGENLQNTGDSRVLVIGNPPWVTNAALGLLASENLPTKSNRFGLRGIDAITGKANFDIAEWIIRELIYALPTQGALAMLCKTATARKVLEHFWSIGRPPEGARIFRIDAKECFGVSVDACFFYCTGQVGASCIADIFPRLDLKAPSERLGFIDGRLVSNVDVFKARAYLDGGCTRYTWRSGIKHDAAKIMEFTGNGETLINGLGETVDIEDEYVYPLLKSSDVGNGRRSIRKSVLVTQRTTADDTGVIMERAPKTWDYLVKHSIALDDRRSSIYRKRSRFSIFGIGPYSFSPWKVAVSGLYKTLRFLAIPPCSGKPTMVDDTCYFLPCDSETEACELVRALSSDEATEFLTSLTFRDAKRPFTVDVLRRLNVDALGNRTLHSRARLRAKPAEVAFA